MKGHDLFRILDNMIEVAKVAILFFALTQLPTCAAAQIQNATTQFAAPPESPRPNVEPDPAKVTGSATISGTVLDTNGGAIEGARVQLSNATSGAVLRTIDSGATGQFVFEGLQPGSYKVTITGEGMTSFVSEPITVHAEQAEIVPNVVLSVSGGTTSITVNGDKEQLSVQQVQIAEQQRVLGVIPNFYSTYDWNAPPMMTKQKYMLSFRSLLDPVSFVGVGAIAGAEQYKNVFPSFGGGWEGYGKRYGAVFANRTSSELLTRAVFPSIFHDDPRYFVKGSGSIRSRAFHAVGSTFVTRGDDGKRKVNFSEILGTVSAGALSNLYFPANERGAQLVYINGFAAMGGNAIDNLIREFILNHITTRAKQKDQQH